MSAEKTPTSIRSGSSLSAWLAQRGLSERIGLGFAAILLASLAAGALIADYVQMSSLERQSSIAAREFAEALALTLGQATSAEDAPASALSAVGPGWDGPYIVRWIAADGSLRMVLPGAAADRPLDSPPMGRARIEQPDGKSAGEVLVWRNATWPTRGESVWRSWWLLIVAALGAFGLFYRVVAARLRSVTAIEHSLDTYAAGIERELNALAVGDQLGRTAAAWNQLIEEISRLRCATPGAQPDGGQEVLAKFEARSLRQMLERLPFGVMRVSQEGKVAYANPTAAEMLGHGKDGIVGQTAASVIHDPTVSRALAAPQALPAGILSVDPPASSGESESAHRFLVLPMEGRGEALVAIQDIRHLREAERARDNFLYHVTHELRTPLTNIHAWAETLTKPDFDDEQTRKECYNVIISETRRLSRLVEDILSVSQLEVGSACFEFGELDLVRLLRQMVQDNLGKADEKGINLTLKVPPKAPKVRGDKQRLSVLISNLIGNAVKYTPQKGWVQVTLDCDEQFLRISVADSGVGIGPEDVPHVFEKFYRANNPSVQELPGTGLGLAIAREVARMHGGDIRLESELGRGSTFTVELPVAPSGS